MVGAEFFHRGMDYFRRRQDGTGKCNIHAVAQVADSIYAPKLSSIFLRFVCFSVFLVVSDDMVWCKRNLAASDTLMVGGNSPQVPLFVTKRLNRSAMEL